MKLQMHSIRFDADQSLITFIQKKADKLDKFFDRIIDGEVFLRLNNEGINNKTVVIKVNIPGEQFLAETASRAFEAAIEEATSVLKRKLRKHKEKLVSH